jgi:histidine triad (HIT) family protein
VFNHEPAGYDCPFCRPVSAAVGPPVEILRRYRDVTVRLNPKWPAKNPGAALVTPIEHYENVYDLPVDLGNALQRAVRDTALAMKQAFGCDGISTRQHNEPGGNQDVWHYHVHVTPRYLGDRLYHSVASWGDEADMHRYAEHIRRAWPDPAEQ